MRSAYAGAEVIGLQHEVPERDQATLATMPGLTLLGPDCADFMDTAALVSLLDVVVSVDTSVAHLAGALGKPVFIMLPHLPDWRWLLNRDDSPWYGSARLFRQSQRGDWVGVMAAVRDALATLLANPPPAPKPKPAAKAPPAEKPRRTIAGTSRRKPPSRPVTPA